MQSLSNSEVATALPWDAMIAAIETVMVDPSTAAPERTAHSVEVPGKADATLLLKPAWVVGEVIAVKVVTFFPDNGSLELPTVNAGMLLFDATNGLLIGGCDANELTTRRTAAASAAAAKRLARSDAGRLLVVGTGALAPMVTEAHCAVREFDTVEVWGRRPEAAAAIAASAHVDAPVNAVTDLAQAVARADVITCVTGATEPLILGAQVAPGTHVDLIGSFTSSMRESDDELMRQGSIWVDTYEDALIAGDLAAPLASGAIERADIQGDLAELIAGPPSARRSPTEITVFKSAGTALEDLAAARLAFG
ncbi:MAG: ornithine cyclodeaminase family protein [Actinomycetota bacterium]|jgi:alanine dehydrogenase|nr:ornithine cyclodeaminase family protein [Actinomycetota bacterium]